MKFYFTKLLFLCALFFAVDKLFAVLILNNPGQFVLGSDELGTGVEGLIQISSSDVILDLNQNVVAYGNNGIVISPNLSGIIIKNGTIEYNNGFGITIGDGCNNIYLNNLALQNCFGGGVLLDGSTTGIQYCFIEDCSIISCTGSNGNPAYGLYIISSSDVSVDNLIVKSCDAINTSSGFGVRIESSTLCQFRGCEIEGSGGDAIGAGFSVVNSTACVFRGCLSIANVAYDHTISATGFGYLFENCSKMYLEQCQSFGNNSYYAGVGIASYNGYRALISNCFCEGNEGGVYGSGIDFINETISYILDCQIFGNGSLFAGTGYGIHLSGLCDQNAIKNNLILTNFGIDYTFGIADDRVPSTALVTNNYAYDNGVNYSITYTAGVILPVINAGISYGSGGIPSGAVGLFDNLSVTP